jgi:hypothetical protein
VCEVKSSEPKLMRNGTVRDKKRTACSHCSTYVAALQVRLPTEWSGAGRPVTWAAGTINSGASCRYCMSTRVTDSRFTLDLLSSASINVLVIPASRHLFACMP